MIVGLENGNLLEMLYQAGFHLHYKEVLAHSSFFSDIHGIKNIVNLQYA